MKTNRFNPLLALLAVTTLVLTVTAGPPLSPRAAANAPAKMSGTVPPKVGADATTHCSTAKKGQCHLPCCG